MSVRAHWRLPPAVLLAALAAACGLKAPVREFHWKAMGTECVFRAAGADAARIAEVSEAARSEVARVEGRLSLFDPASDVSRLNSAPRGEWLEVSADAESVLKTALEVAARSGGAFDPTVAPLMQVWGFRNPGRTNEPPASELAEAMCSVGYAGVRLDGAGVSLDLDRGSLDLGGVAKGYGVDAAFERIAAMGGTDYMVDIGGNMRCAGRGMRPGGWVVGVRNPFDRDDVLGTVVLTGGEAVATSGNYERFVVLSGVRYAHIIDPRTGRPVRGMAGVTVLAPSACLADALSTALFVAGPEEGGKIIASFGGCEALFVRDELPMAVLATPGFAARFRPRGGLRLNITVLDQQPGPTAN
ncbi:MAG: FAD:protein FMN transferase [Lentisphaerae bacterium]|nr:FAD:protein FMN transferase [Lentisphaerota bacterium]